MASDGRPTPLNTLETVNTRAPAIAKTDGNETRRSAHLALCAALDLGKRVSLERQMGAEVPLGRVSYSVLRDDQAIEIVHSFPIIPGMRVGLSWKLPLGGEPAH